MQALIDLSLSANDEQKQDSNVSEVVRRALTKHREEQAEAASTEIVALLRRMEAHKVTARKEIRQLRNRAKHEVARLAELDRAWAYAEQTNNFLPVLVYFGIPVSRHDFSDPAEYERMTQVPEDFNPEPTE